MHYFFFVVEVCARASSKFSVYRASMNPCRRVYVGSSLVEPVPPEVLHVLFLTIHVPLHLLALQCAVLSTKLDILRSRQLKVSVRRAPGSPCRHLHAGNSLFELMAPGFPRFCLWRALTLGGYRSWLTAVPHLETCSRLSGRGLRLFGCCGCWFLLRV